MRPPAVAWPPATDRLGPSLILSWKSIARRIFLQLCHQQFTCCDRLTPTFVAAMARGTPLVARQSKGGETPQRGRGGPRQGKVATFVRQGRARRSPAATLLPASALWRVQRI